MAFEIIGSIFGNTLFFIFFVIAIFAVIGWLSGSFSLGGLGGFLMFIHIVTSIDDALLTNLLYITMVAVLFFTAFRTYGFAFKSGGETA